MGSPAANPNFATMTMALNAATYSAYKRLVEKQNNQEILNIFFCEKQKQIQIINGFYFHKKGLTILLDVPGYTSLHVTSIFSLS